MPVSLLVLWPALELRSGRCVVSKSRRPMACLGSTSKQDSAPSPRRNCARYLCVCPWQSLGGQREERDSNPATTSIVRAVSVVRTKVASRWKHLVPRLLTSFSSAALGLERMVPSRLMLDSATSLRCGCSNLANHGRELLAVSSGERHRVALGYKGYRTS